MSQPVTKEIFLKAWGNFPSGVSVITFYEEGGAVHGLTANAVCSVSLEPFMVLVCIDHKAQSFPILSKSDRFVMNFLSKGQEEACMHFARSDTEGEPPFTFSRSAHGVPVLEGCLAHLECRIMDKHPAGDHTIFVGEVEEIEFHGGEPLVFYEGKFLGIAPAVS